MKSKNLKKTSESEKNQKTDDALSMRIQPKIADDWELEDAVRTLAKAEEIKADQKMMGKIRPMLDKKVRSIEALKELYNSKYNKPSEAMGEDDQDGDED
jgi:hypothetical protein